VEKALNDTPVAPPGTRFIYSDINFILLGEIVRKLSGRPLPEFVRDTVFRPLGMKDSMFNPPAGLRRRIAPTETLPGAKRPLRGVVHDPTTRYMDGIAGHAGLFTTADDLARFAGMMLGLGKSGKVRIFSPLTVRKFTSPQSPPGQPVLRGLGWDIESPYSGNRGELYPVGSYGHTGFTGTSLWIDPASDSFVILLANSVHPRQRPAVTSLRGRTATVVAAALGIDLPGLILTGYNEASTGVRRVIPRNAEVLTGLDVLALEKFTPLQGKRIGLITNHTGLTREGRRNVDVMIEAGVRVTALFSPEHGLLGAAENDVAHATDQETGIRVWSLYAPENRRPTAEMVRDLDALVFDIQDIGVRYYTYVSTMAYAMEEAAKHGLEFYVLDRPNPLNGVQVEGPVLDKDLLSFVGYFPLPVRHGMTVGELARLFNGENSIGANLHVVPVKNWQRGDWFDSTGLVWMNPSPNMRGFLAALLYPAVAMLEFSGNYSVGRGTDAPFEQVGADWIHGRELAARLNSRWIPGVRFYPTQFHPSASQFAGKTIEGVRFVITDREAFSCERLGLELAAALVRLYPGKINLSENRALLGSSEVSSALEAGEDPEEIQARGQERVREFVQLREKYLLY
jgi:uncharacterized protein YbbC (DUF1343 family)